MNRFATWLVLLWLPAAAFASTPAVDQAASAVFHETMSPYCPGLLLADCRSDAAAQLRSDIRAALDNGASVAEVRAQLETVYGDRVRAAPRGSGFGLVAWLTPFAFVGAGILGLGLWTNRRVRGGLTTSPEPLPEIDPRLRQRITSELSERW